MQTNRNRTWQRLTLLTVTALLLAACSGEEPTPTTVPATSAPAATTAAATDTPEAADAPESPLSQPESPLSQSESPLAQPESPLTTAPPTATALPYPVGEEEARALAEETLPPEPLEGHASLSGVIYTYVKDRAVYGTGFYLTPAEEVDGEFVPPEIYFGPQPEKGDIIHRTDGSGKFQLDNVPPGHYYLMLWTVYNYLNTFDAEESNQPLLIEVEEGDQLNLGVLYAGWP